MRRSHFRLVLGRDDKPRTHHGCCCQKRLSTSGACSGRTWSTRWLAPRPRTRQRHLDDAIRLRTEAGLTTAAAMRALIDDALAAAQHRTRHIGHDPTDRYRGGLVSASPPSAGSVRGGYLGQHPPRTKDNVLWPRSNFLHACVPVRSCAFLGHRTASTAACRSAICGGGDPF